MQENILGKTLYKLNKLDTNGNRVILFNFMLTVLDAMMLPSKVTIHNIAHKGRPVDLETWEIAVDTQSQAIRALIDKIDMARLNKNKESK